VSTGHCPHCRRSVIWCKTRRGKNIPLNQTVDPAGTLVPLKGRAWEPWELRSMGEPWSDFADAGSHIVHILTCRLWPRPDPAKHRGSAQGHLACMCCGTVEASVRHCDDQVDRCRDCRQSTVDEGEDIPADIPAEIITTAAAR
jgi:hypothetical protein